MNDHQHVYILENITVQTLSYSDILKYSSSFFTINSVGFFDIIPQHIEINFGLFTNPVLYDFPDVSVNQNEDSITLTCNCDNTKSILCEHQVQVLYNILDRIYLRIFFDKQLLINNIRMVSKDYGMQDEPNLSDYFKVEYANKSYQIKPKSPELIPIGADTTAILQKQLIPQKKVVLPVIPDNTDKTRMVIVFGKHKYYDQFAIELFEVQITQKGNIRNPIKAIDPLDLIWKTENVDEAKFFTALYKFQNNFTENQSKSDIEGLKTIVKNPLNLNVYYHDININNVINAASMVAITLKKLDVNIILSVDKRKLFYEISGELINNDKAYILKTLTVRYEYFILIEKTLYLVANSDHLRIIDYFKKNNQKIIIHSSQYEEFRISILEKLESHVTVNYSYLKPASSQQLHDQCFDLPPGKIIYLEDQENHISLTPVIRYGNVEVPVFSRKQIYDTDQNGNVFTVDRDNDMEIEFTSLLLRQHPYFNEQIDEPYFYLPKKDFLENEWFLKAFEILRENDITIMGFKELKEMNLNSHTAKISINIKSGIDWFNTYIKVNYGSQIASVKQLQKAIRKKSKYVMLDDGTMGILPGQWIQKFTEYFQKGEVIDEIIKTPKSSFLDIASLYEDFLSDTDKAELKFYENQLANFEEIKEVDVPETLNGTLRDYQKQGLNWLNFLDDFNFGACLADDMGLGKTIQIIAFILSQRAKRDHNTNLVIVPTSLLFNWQAEVARFAPSINLYINYGNAKIKHHKDFDNYEIILTTYGTLLTDIKFLKDYRFNYIFLDESQAIKNPESQRYKAARMLQSRNKIVLTGTPVENNTFDIFGQLSFACPGLLGNKQQFKDLYSIPIDKFDNTERAKELQQKIKPFVLRRTKKQVAKELPDKTEMIIYCEMGEAQRKIYNAYEDELRNFIANKEEENLSKNSMYVLKGITKLRQICDSPKIINDQDFKGNISAKIEVLMEQIDNNASHHKILVFSQFVTMLDLIREELEIRGVSFEYLTGQTKNRAEVVNEFQNNENVRVFLISLKAGGTGLNLTEADYVYLVDPWWNPAVENQAIDRVYRIGQKKNVIAVRLICPDTLEEKMMKLQADKSKLANDLIKTEGSILKSLSKKELIEILRK